MDEWEEGEESSCVEEEVDCVDGRKGPLFERDAAEYEGYEEEDIDGNIPYEGVSVRRKEGRNEEEDGDCDFQRMRKLDQESVAVDEDSKEYKIENIV